MLCSQPEVNRDSNKEILLSLLTHKLIVCVLFADTAPLHFRVLGISGDPHQTGHKYEHDNC